VVNVAGVAADLAHIDTAPRVTAHTGAGALPAALYGAHLVLVPAGVPRKPGMTRDDLFNINAGARPSPSPRARPARPAHPAPPLPTRLAHPLARSTHTAPCPPPLPDTRFLSFSPGIVRTLVEGVARYCPSAWVAIISNPVNSTVPIAAEVLRSLGSYDPRRLFGVTALDVVRAEAFLAAELGVDPGVVSVPVIGGHAGERGWLGGRGRAPCGRVAKRASERAWLCTAASCALVRPASALSLFSAPPALAPQASPSCRCCPP
jgi:malate dehydrogenase